jgi:hypothetical protein
MRQPPGFGDTIQPYYLCLLAYTSQFSSCRSHLVLRILFSLITCVFWHTRASSVLVDIGLLYLQQYN